MKRNKPVLMVVSPQTPQRDEVVSTLAPLYTIWHFDSMSAALPQARLHHPAAMLIAEDSIRRERFALLRSMRQEPSLAALPVTILLPDDDPARREDALSAGATACVAKPYRKSFLLAAVSSTLSRAVEKTWDSLPRLEAAALKCSVAVFENVTDRIAEGVSIPYEAISTACQPLILAIRSRNIKNILHGVREHDNYTYAHSLRVGVYLSMFGSSIGLSAQDQDVLTIGGLLHDLGKTAIPLPVLNKPGRLSDAEFNVMKDHVPATLKILESCAGLPRAALIIAGQHHERLDGSGYPNGLAGGKLNELARMAGIADVFSALTDRRAYKPAMAPESAFEIMRRDMSAHLDQSLVERFRQMLLDTRMT